jgi:hypothetical protein
LFHSSTTGKKLLAGEHEYPFEFDLPGHLPSSFKGTRGKIEYYCSALLSRPILRNDITTKKIIHLKRSLVNETRATQTHHTTFNEGQLLDGKISYQISTPIMTFREGGLVQTELALKSSDSDIVIEEVEYGLKEQIHYRTTGEQANAVIAKVDEEIYPFGRKKIKVDPNDTNPIKINFRLCNWVNCDVDSQLININHKLSFTAYISKTINIEHDEETNQQNDRRFSVPVPSQTESRDSGRTRRTTSLLPPNRANITRANARTNTMRNRNSRTFSLSGFRGPHRAPLITKVEKKLIHFEIPIVITTKSYKSRQTHDFDNFDRPPAYAIASMIPPPPEYVPDNPEFLINDYLESNEFIVHDEDI